MVGALMRLQEIAMFDPAKTGLTDLAAERETIPPITYSSS